MTRVILFGMVLILFLGCASPATPPTPPASQPQQSSQSTPAQRSSGPKRITAAIAEDPPAIKRDITGRTSAGALELERLLNGGLVLTDDKGLLQPELAEAVPTVDNGLWKLLPDGRMEITWKIKPGAQWHDGTPFTSADLEFTHRVWQDRGQPVLRNVQLDSVDRVETPDPRTVVVHWKQPLIYADTLFSLLLANPMPKHLLEQTFDEDEANFPQASYWTDGFIGTGAFKLKSWEKGSALVLSANEQYILGRPKLDEIEVRIISDPSTLVANVLSGAVDVGPLERGLSLDLALQAKPRWSEGRVEIAPASQALIMPQLMDPSPAIVANVQFRRALYHATDRQTLVDTLMHGYTGVADGYIGPTDPEYPFVSSAFIKYEYDLRKASQMIQDLGYSRGSDGFFRDASGQRLEVESRANANQDLNAKIVLSVADTWQQAGVGVNTLLVPSQQAADRAFAATFPSFSTIGQSRYLERLRFRHSGQTPLPSNNYVGNNASRYQNAEWDALIDRYYVTIPMQERYEVIRQLLRHLTENLPFMALFYDSDQLLVNNRIENIIESEALGATQAWNSYLWDVR
jgi:peptide/nickel transport system substrate-binding protein